MPQNSLTWESCFRLAREDHTRLQLGAMIMEIAVLLIVLLESEETVSSVPRTPVYTCAGRRLSRCSVQRTAKERA